MEIVDVLYHKFKMCLVLILLIGLRNDVIIVDIFSDKMSISVCVENSVNIG